MLCHPIGNWLYIHMTWLIYTCDMIYLGAFRRVCVCMCAQKWSRLKLKLHHHILPHTATYCNILQHTATYCNILQHTVTHCNKLQHTAAHCSTLQHTAAHCNTMHHTAIRCSTLHHAQAQSWCSFSFFISQKWILIFTLFKIKKHKTGCGVVYCKCAHCATRM